jgi:hypothetical protein
VALSRLGVAVVLGGLIVAGGATAWWLRRGSGPAAVGADVVSLKWDGKYRGEADLPTTVNWCPGTRLAIIEAVSNDTGFVMVIHAADTLTRGTHVVLPFEFIANSQQLPAVTAALRWPADSGVLAGFRGQSGLVELVPANGTLSGTFTIRMQPPMSADSISVAGAFRNLVIASRAVGCP